MQEPGQVPQGPGEYIEYGPRGGEAQKQLQVTIEPGDKSLPATERPGRT